MQQPDQYILNTDGKWKEGPIEVWFKHVEDLIADLKTEGLSADPETTHQKEDRALWDFVAHVYERSTAPCLQAMCETLFQLSVPGRVRWYS